MVDPRLTQIDPRADPRQKFDNNSLCARWEGRMRGNAGERGVAGQGACVTDMADPFWLSSNAERPTIDDRRPR